MLSKLDVSKDDFIDKGDEDIERLNKLTGMLQEMALCKFSVFKKFVVKASIPESSETLLQFFIDCSGTWQLDLF